MATQPQIDPNRKNAKRSTGPRTETGKSNAAVNARTLGLFTRQDHVKLEESGLYRELCEAANNELTPEGFLEESCVSQITGANWRLHLCDSAEAELPDFSEESDKTRRSIERARAHAVSVLNRSLAQLRKLQTERVLREQIPLGKVSHVPVAEIRILLAALCNLERGKQLAAKTGAQEAGRYVNELLNAPLPPAAGSVAEEPKLGSICEIDGASAAQAFLASFEALQKNPNLPCPCKSGQTYAQCCGGGDSPDLGMAA